nr:glycoprotein VP1a [Alongshan virus]WLW42120.1 putative glycoprotein VP1a [Alongshan virus]
MLPIRFRACSGSLWGATLLMLFLSSCSASPGSSQEISTSSPSAPSQLWGLLLGRKPRSSHLSSPSSYEKAIVRFQERLSRSRRLATSESCRPWPSTKGIGTTKRKGPLWTKVLSATSYIVPEYGIPLGKVITGAIKIPAAGDCSDPSLAWQMKEWAMNCSDERAYTWGCERNNYYRYEYDTRIDRTKAIWKYRMHTDPQTIDLGDCTVRGRRSEMTIWGSHKELYPLLDVPEGKLHDGSARWITNVKIMPDGTCVFQANKYEKYRLEGSEVTLPKIEYSAPFRVMDQLTPHGPSVGKVTQNQPEPTLCLVKGKCDYPLGRVPCVGQNHIDVRQTMIISSEEGVLHRLTVEVQNTRGPCDPVVVADTYLEEVAKVHGPTSTKLLYNVALHHSTVTVRAGDSWLEYNVTKNVIRPSMRLLPITPPCQSIGTTGFRAGLATSREVSRGLIGSSHGRSSLLLATLQLCLWSSSWPRLSRRLYRQP